ncbi:MAG: SpoIID/LytB domain-containing protein [Actinomycetota bacterium]
MRRALAFVLVVSAVALWPTASARPADSFTFFGSGWGHGLGMSQWGAYGLAQEGWSRAEILTHFYSGTKVGGHDSPPATLRVGLVQGRERVRLEAGVGAVDLRLGDPKDGHVVATIPAGETWVVREAGQKYRILDAFGQRVGDDVGDPGTNLFAAFEPNGARVRVPEAGHTYGRGFIEFNIHNCQSDCRERLILVVGAEEYLYGLAEVPSSWPNPALEAQAIAARTYAFTKAASGQNRPGCNCGLYASSFDQVYAGYDKESGVDGDRWVAAVDGTTSQVVLHQGQSIQAFYMSSSGGFTENNENVWGGTPIPYLRGVCDPGDYTPDNPNAVWNMTLTADQVTTKLSLGIGRITAFTNTVRGVSGRIVTTLVQGETGSVEISGSVLRSTLKLPDDRVWINANRLVTGSIRSKYDAINCRPGLPTSRQVRLSDGARQKFERATIYFKDGVGAHALSGFVLEFYMKKGGPSGRLGFPTSDVRRLANGATRASFERGKITCSASGSCRLG